VSAAKNQRLLYVLLPAVLVIWGLIFQRIWAAVDGTSDETRRPEPPLRAVTNGPTRQLPKLLLNYADPFRPARTTSPAVVAGGSRVVSSFFASERAVSAKGLNLPVAQPPVAVVPVQWPVLKYLGSITNARLNTCVALLTLENGEAMIKAGDSYHNVKVVRIFRDSVQVLFQGQRKTLVKSEN
jgi:hypothetical protein